MRWEEKAALDAARQIEAAEREAQALAQGQRVRSMREIMQDAVLPAREAGFSAQELGDSWYLPADLIATETDRRHVKRPH